MAMTLDGSAGVTYPVVAGASSAVQASSAKIIQVVNTQVSTVATSAVNIPNDNTIPQITEGAEYMTLAITPSSATNTLLINVVMQLSANSPASRTMALFQDSTANALAAITSSTATNTPVVLTFTHKMTAGTTSSTTFRVRYGSDAGATVTVSGVAGVGSFGGVVPNSITIYEVAG